MKEKKLNFFFFGGGGRHTQWCSGITLSQFRAHIDIRCQGSKLGYLGAQQMLYYHSDPKIYSFWYHVVWHTRQATL